MVVLLVSILASIAVWTYLFSFKFAITLITAVFIHEYGHFYWMGREGIKDKDMFFMPPFGAIARAKEPWASYGAEMRIALAGPASGLLSVLLFFSLWVASSSDIFLASVALACMINLFNLVFPIPILDGGRVIKSVLYSINRTIGDAFYLIGFLFLGLTFVFGYLSPIFIVLIGYFLYQEWSNIVSARRIWNQLRQAKIDIVKSGLSENFFESEKLESEYSRLDAIVNMKKMNWKEITLCLFIFGVLIFIYSVTMYRVSSLIDLHQLIKYFS